MPRVDLEFIQAVANKAPLARQWAEENDVDLVDLIEACKQVFMLTESDDLVSVAAAGFLVGYEVRRAQMNAIGPSSANRRRKPNA